MTLPRYPFRGGTALVTGAAGGIGAHLARALAARGSHLALADRDVLPLRALATELRDAHPGVTVTSHAVDLADPTEVERLADEVRAAHTTLTLLVNNAGVGLSGTVESVDPVKAAAGAEEFTKLLTFPADKAAAMIVDAVDRRRPRLLIGASAVVPDVLARVTPAHYGWVLALLRRGSQQAARRGPGTALPRRR